MKEQKALIAVSFFLYKNSENYKHSKKHVYFHTNNFMIWLQAM